MQKINKKKLNAYTGSSWTFVVNELKFVTEVCINKLHLFVPSCRFITQTVSWWKIIKSPNLQRVLRFWKIFSILFQFPIQLLYNLTSILLLISIDDPLMYNLKKITNWIIIKYLYLQKTHRYIISASFMNLLEGFESMNAYNGKKLTFFYKLI